LVQSVNLARQDLDGNICANFVSEKRGRLRRVEGTQRDTALGRRAEEKAAFGQMSRMRQVGPSTKESRLTGSWGIKLGRVEEEVVRWERQTGTTLVMMIQQ
jgi:hypothetical protein